MQNNTFQDFSVDKGGSRLLYIKTAFPDGRKAFYFMVCPHSKIPTVQSLLNKGAQMNLEHFGNVIAHGWNEPDINTMRSLEQQYKVKLLH